LADFDVGTVSEMNLCDPPGNLRLDGYDFASDDFADGLDVNRHALTNRRRDRYWSRRPLEVGRSAFTAAPAQRNKNNYGGEPAVRRRKECA
jgi:hypothetical protein